MTTPEGHRDPLNRPTSDATLRHRGGCLVDVGCHDDHMCLCGVGDAPPQVTPAQLIERGVVLSRRIERGDRIDPLDAHIIDDLIALYRVALGNPPISN